MIPGVFVAIASSGRPVNIRWALSLTALATSYPVGMCNTWMIQIGPERDKNREYLCEQALEAQARYIFFLDDDTVCPNDTLKALIYAAEQDPKIMVTGGIYCTKEAVPHPLVFKRIGDGPFWNWKAGEIFDCHGLGTGCMLIKTEVFQKIPKPWFVERYDAPKNEFLTVGEQKIPVAQNGGTEDLFFCQKVIDAGFRIVAHGGVLPAHIDQNGVIYTLPADSYPLKVDNGETVLEAKECVAQ